MKVTRALLKKLDACDGGLRLVEPLLPMTFDKNVEKNNSTAIKLIELYATAGSQGEVRRLFDDLEWLLRMSISNRLQTTQMDNVFLLRREIYPWLSNNTLDPLTVAQIMSWIADKDKVLR